MVSPQPGIVKDGVPSKRYPVPGIPRNQPQRTAGIGHFDTGIFRSVRTGRGRRYDNDSLNIRKSILEEIERDGLSIVEIVICYRRLHINVIYAATIETIRTQGAQEYLDGCWQYSLPREYWSINGAQPEAELTPAPPAAQQMSLF